MACSQWQPPSLARLDTAGLDDAVYAVSDETKRSMRGRAANRCVTLQHGIDVAGTAALAAEREAVRRELGIGTDEWVIGTVANYREQKDYPNLLRAAAELETRGIPARIVAVGQGQLERGIAAEDAQIGRFAAQHGGIHRDVERVPAREHGSNMSVVVDDVVADPDDFH